MNVGKWCESDNIMWKLHVEIFQSGSCEFDSKIQSSKRASESQSIDPGRVQFVSLETDEERCKQNFHSSKTNGTNSEKFIRAMSKVQQGRLEIDRLR